ncbi:MAG: hypothetical protein Greene07147_169 [Parcubacteria group bacterium Greene0714_7]|nr:MAG: hypothetical protein Greene07147_169 [Parcubacteria group bacterium Greene0714_7]
MSKLIISIGLPGSGKTCILKSFAERYGYEYTGVDQVKESYGLSRNNTATEREWDDMRQQIVESAKNNKTLVVDVSFLMATSLRQRFIAFARENGVTKIQGLFVDTPAELAWKRAESRKVRISRAAFDNKLTILKSLPPDINDGFDSLFTTDECGKLVRSEMAYRPREFQREKLVA